MTVPTHIPDDTATWAAGLLGYRATPRPATEPPIAFVFTRPAWQADAACRGMGTARWFPERGEGTKRQVAICADCPVRADCLQYALDFPDQTRGGGIWGGLTGRQMIAYRRKVARMAAGEAA